MSSWLCVAQVCYTVFKLTNTYKPWWGNLDYPRNRLMLYLRKWVLNVSFYTPVDRDADPSPWIFMTPTSFWSWPLTMLPKTTPTYPVDAQGWNSGWNFSTFSLISVPAPNGGSQRQVGSRHISEGAKKGILPRAKTSFPYILFWACPWSSESSETVRTAHHKK